MSFFEGTEFFSCLAIALVPAIILGILEKSLNIYRFILSICFIILVFKDNTYQFLFLIIFLIWTLCITKIYLYICIKSGKDSKIYFGALLCVLSPLAISKIAGLFSANILGFLGISYITFKVVQIIIESYDGIIKKISALEFLNFILFFPTFSSGPIDRSRRFEADCNAVPKRGEYLELVGTGILKLFIGAVYKFVFSVIAYTILQNNLSSNYQIPYLIGYAYCYGIYMFFDFAGYSLMAVGVSYILGIKTPDNFKAPFISKDISDFWNRWHISLSHWFRDFIFSRLIMLNLRKKWIKNRLNGAVLGLIINMSIMGIWHGLTSYYIIYGVYHGILLAANEIYQKKSEFYRKNKQKKWYKCLSWMLTINFVMFGFLIFSGHIDMVGYLRRFI